MLDDDRWLNFQRFARETGQLDGSFADWDEAFQFEWKRLDNEQKKMAHDGLVLRAGKQDTASKSLPINYLKRRMWERKLMSTEPQTRVASDRVLPVQACSVCRGSGFDKGMYCSCEDGAYERITQRNRRELLINEQA